MSPSEDSTCGRVEDVLGVWAGKIRSEGHVEGVVDGGLGRRRGDDGRTGMRTFMLRCHGRHVHIRSGHAEAGAHTGPMPHIGQFIHGERRSTAEEWKESKRKEGKGRMNIIWCGVVRRKHSQVRSGQVSGGEDKWCMVMSQLHKAVVVERKGGGSWRWKLEVEAGGGSWRWKLEVEAGGGSWRYVNWRLKSGGVEGFKVKVTFLPAEDARASTYCRAVKLEVEAEASV